MIKPKNNLKNLKILVKNHFLTKLQLLRKNDKYWKKMSKIEIHLNFGSLWDVLTPKPAACFLSVKDNLMSKMLHEYFFDMQLFKSSEFGWVENQYLQLNIYGCCMRCLKEKQPILLER